MKNIFLKRKKGVTIIELIMVIVIVGVLVGASSMYIKETIDLWNFLNFRNEVVSQLRTALLRMGREIRLIKDESSITAAQVSRLDFTDVNDNTISYQLSSGNLLRYFNSTTASDILAAGVQGLYFCYYDSDNNPICSPECNCSVDSADLTNIYRIKIKMDIQSGDQSKHLESQIYPRNF